MRKGRRRPVWLLRTDAPFPDPEEFDSEGLLALGGELTVQRLAMAYRSGVFPWYAEDVVPLWWSPDPRAILTPESLHESRSLRKTMRRGGYALTWNRSFRAVMAACAEDRSDGTWILPEMIDAYEELHLAGMAHSLEVWRGEDLVGGIYGVQIGRLFAAESMFHRETDMSKVALVTLVRALFRQGIELFDVQFVTDHLATMGAFEIPRREYLAAVRRATQAPLVLTDPLLPG